MSIQKLYAASVGAVLLCATPLHAEGHGGLALEIPKNLCQTTQDRLQRWASDEQQWTAYVTTITSEQAAADCFDLGAENRLYAAHSKTLKVLAKIKALEKCTVDNRAMEWCVVIGTLRNR